MQQKVNENKSAATCELTKRPNRDATERPIRAKLRFRIFSFSRVSQAQLPVCETEPA